MFKAFLRFVYVLLKSGSCRILFWISLFRNQTFDFLTYCSHKTIFCVIMLPSNLSYLDDLSLKFAFTVILDGLYLFVVHKSD